MAIVALNSAATGLRALSTQLDVISNNIANANNDGFKASRANFEDLMYQYYQDPGVQDEASNTRPIGLAVGLGTRVSGTQLDLTQGSAITTGRPLDAYIEGDGFFQVKTPPGVANGLAYTRTGKFFVNENGELVLDGNTGYKVDPPITIPNNATGINISTDGRVSVNIPNQTALQDVGQMQLARFVNPQGLRQLGSNLYATTDASGQPQLSTPAKDGLGQIRQGAVEASNVDPVKELVDLIKTQRTFELNSQSIQAADQMLQQISNLRR
jgi:flagellar basal-body rod protein FlgG